MKRNFTKEFIIDYSLIVQESNLKNIFNFIQSRYSNIHIMAKCSDGSSLESNSIDDIFDFENPDYQKIISMEIVGKDFVLQSQEQSKTINSQDRLSIVFGSDPVFILNVLDKKIKPFYEKVKIIFQSNSDENFDYTHKMINKELLKMKASYYLFDCFNQSDFPNIIDFFVLFILVIIFVFLYPNIGHILAVNKVSNITGLILLFFLTIIYFYLSKKVVILIKKIMNYLFPKIAFDIGDQKTDLKKREKWRRGILATLITIILGVLVNYAYSFLTTPKK
jgi:hypothetical protein